MAYKELFRNYRLPSVNDTQIPNDTSYTHPFILKNLFEYSKEIKMMGLWKIVDSCMVILEVKGYSQPIYVQLLTQRNEDIALFFEGADKYVTFIQQYRKNKIQMHQLPIIGMIKYVDKCVLEKYDRDLLDYLNVACKGRGAYPLIRTYVDGELVFPNSYSCLLMARTCECLMRMFTYMYTDNIKKMYKNGLLMYQVYNEIEDVYEYKMAKLTQINK